MLNTQTTFIILPLNHYHVNCLQVMTGCPEAVWGLMEGGEIYIRTEMSSHCPQGLGWARLDLSQLGKILSLKKTQKLKMIRHLIENHDEKFHL